MTSQSENICVYIAVKRFHYINNAEWVNWNNIFISLHSTKFEVIIQDQVITKKEMHTSQHIKCVFHEWKTKMKNGTRDICMPKHTVEYDKAKFFCFFFFILLNKIHSQNVMLNENNINGQLSIVFVWHMGEKKKIRHAKQIRHWWLLGMLLYAKNGK